MPHVSPKGIERIPFALPPLADQGAHVQRVRRDESKRFRVGGLQSAVVTDGRALMSSALREVFTPPAPGDSEPADA